MVKIKECGEPLVEIKKVCPGLVINLWSRGKKNKRKAFLRKTAAKMLIKAKNCLPKGITFVIGDAWRSKRDQEETLEHWIEKMIKKYPFWPRGKILKEAEKYVAPAKGKYVSGHMTGGAVDLRLWKNGRKLPMKSSKLSYQENAKPNQPKLPKYIQKNREIMFLALKKAGFSNCSNEFWHWSFGDIWWAKRTKNKVAIYGTIEKIA